MRDENRRCKQCTHFDCAGTKGDVGWCKADTPHGDNPWPRVQHSDWCAHWAAEEPEGPPAAQQVAVELGRLLRDDPDAVARALQQVVAGEARRLRGAMYEMPVSDPRGDEPLCLSEAGEEFLEEMLSTPEAGAPIRPRWHENADKFIEHLMERDQ